jgi:hypothetical protein
VIEFLVVCEVSVVQPRCRKLVRAGSGSDAEGLEEDSTTRRKADSIAGLATKEKEKLNWRPSESVRDVVGEAVGRKET